MITQEALFGTPIQVPEPKRAGVPPVPPTPVIITEPLGQCCKCPELAYLRSPSGKYIYCEKHGHCGRKYLDRQTTCGISIEKFVLHPRLNIWVCPCMPVV